MEESYESTVSTTEHEHEHEEHRPGPPLPPAWRREKPKYRGGAGADHCKKAETEAPDKFDLNDPVIYQPSLGEAISLEIAAVDPDGDRNILYRLRYRSDHNHDGPMYTDTARSVDLFKGEELEDDSDPA